MEFREFLNKLEEMGELKRVKREVDPRFEICAIMKKVDREKGPAILCEKAKGYPQMSVAGNLFATERRIALGIGAKEADIAAVPAGDIIPDIIAPIHTKAKDELKPCQMVSSGAVREVVVTKDIDVMKAVPVPTHCEKDGGPYIAAGVVVAKHPDTGDRVTQVIEIMVKGPDKLTIAPATPMMPQAYARAEELNQPFEVAIVIGVAPAIMYAACATAGLLALDKFELAGALQGRGVDLVKCETVDLEVPADAEFVIEGKMPPKVREEMGPYGDYFGTYYHYAEKQPVVNISAISHRRDAIYQDILADGDETGLLVKVSAEIDLLKSLKAAFPMVRRIHITLSSTLHHTILSVGKTRDADIKPLLYHMLSLPGSLFSKLIIVVDGDIDVTNPEEVEWAIASTVQADRDVLILPGLKGIPLNPCVGAEGICTNMGVDATRPLSIPAEKFERSDVPRGVKEKIEREWAQLFR